MAAPTLPEARQSYSYSSWPLTFKLPIDGWRESLEAGIVWDELRSYADVRERGEKLFATRPRSERVKCWEALNDFSRQARSYYEALDATSGSARGLLSYYSALNLAKAEILHTSPELVINKRIRHGLSFDIGRNTTIRGDSVKVTRGVFPLLYEMRTGKTLPQGTVLPVRRLLAHVPEIGREYHITFNETSNFHVGWYRTLGDGQQSWPVVLLTCTREEIENTWEWRRMSRYFEPVEKPSDWRTRFPEVGPRVHPSTLLQAKQTYAGEFEHSKCVELAKKAFGSSIDTAMEGWSDFAFVPSLYKWKNLPMPSYLARYALMFYLSSLIRYRPSRLNPRREQITVWLLESFARQAPLPLLVNGLEGVVQHNVIFGA